MYIVELEIGVWLSTWRGNPGRTLVKDSARQFKTKAQGYRAIATALGYRDFDNPKVKKV